MKKIGLFLGVSASSGGMFQYSQSMLAAVAALPRASFSVVVAYTDPLWRQHIARYQVDSVYIDSGQWSIMLSKLWRGMGLSNRLWRLIAPLFHPIVRTLVQDQCNLWIFPAQDAWSYQAPVPSVGTIHDLMHRYERRFPEVSAMGRYYIRERHFRDMCKWSKAVLVDSEYGKGQVQESYQLDPQKIFPLPYVRPQYIYDSRPSPDFDKKYNLPNKFIFYPAQFWRHKNHIRLLRAIAKLKQCQGDIALVLVGSNKNGYQDAIQAIDQLGLKERVRILGYVPDEDIAELYRRARALVMPTFFGPTNIPPLEAFVLGCPVAISDIYGVREQVKDAALLFNPESVEEITEVIHKLWIDDALCAHLAESGKKRAQEWGQEDFNQTLLAILGQLTCDQNEFRKVVSDKRTTTA